VRRCLTGEAKLYGPTIQGRIAQCPVCLSYTGCDPGDYRITCKFCSSLYQPRKMTCAEWLEWQEGYANSMIEADKILTEIRP
jgi:hypothetical protein